MTNPIQCVINSCNSVDNVNTDVELLSISTTVPNSVYPLYFKFIIDNTSSQNTLHQMTINLKSDDYSYSNGAYLINSFINVIPNNTYNVKAKVFFSDNSFSNYSPLKSFTSNPTTPVILSAYGDAETSIFISITPQLEVSSYSVILGYIDYNNSQQLDILDGVTCKDNTKQFIELTNLLQNIQYDISLIANNSYESSKISNCINATTKPQPDPITNFNGSFDTNAEISLSWDAPANSIYLPITKYLIEDGSGNLLETINDGSLTSYTFPNAFNINETYSFQIIAVHTVNNVDYQSSPSSIFTISIPEPGEVLNLFASLDPSTLLIT